MAGAKREQLSSAAGSRTVAWAPGSLCQSSCSSRLWLAAVAVVHRFRMLVTKGICCLHWPSRMFPYQFIFSQYPKIICKNTAFLSSCLLRLLGESGILLQLLKPVALFCPITERREGKERCLRGDCS